MTRVPANRYVVFCLIAVVGLFCDLFSKQQVFDDLGFPAGPAGTLAQGKHTLFDAPPFREGESATYIDGWLTFQLWTSFNRGALWGLGQGYTWVFAILSVIAIIAVVVWLFIRGAANSLWLTVSLGFIMAGTLGNLYDRMGWHGYVDQNGDPIFAVRDFLLFTFGTFHWPVFNFADVCLVTGAIMLVVQSFRAEVSQETLTENEEHSAESTTNAGAA